MGFEFQFIIGLVIFTIGTIAGHMIEHRKHRNLRAEHLEQIEAALSSIGIKRQEFLELRTEVSYLKRIIVQMERSHH